MNYLFIVNPKAGKKSCEERIRQGVSSLGESFLSENNVEIKLTEYMGHATEIAKEAASKGEKIRIYACGGDGTLSEVINGAYGFENCEVGVIPVGTGNDFAKTVAESVGAQGKDAVQTAFSDFKTLVLGESRPTDLIEACGKLSINVTCVGFDADAAAGVHKFSKLPLVSGKMAYKLSVLKCLISWVKHDFKVIVDGEEIDNKNYLLAVAANARYYGGGYKCAPEADATDGLIDFLWVPTMSRFKFLRLVGYYEKGEHLKRFDICKLIKCKSVQICSDKPVELCIDGESVTEINPVIKVLDTKINFIYPKIKNELSNALKRDTIVAVN